MENSLKIALLGYGKMGRELERIALERGHEIIIKIDSASDWEAEGLDIRLADVALEFTTPSTAVDNIKRCFEASLPVVSGTTGWQEHFPELSKHCLQQHQSLFYASNFSVSVNIFFEVNKMLARLMNAFEDYEVNIEEIHHVTKIDAPSGTAIVLANDIVSNMERMEKWTEHPVGNAEISIKSTREENVPGTHIVTYESHHDSIEIRHTAKSRRGFALGAVLAAEFLYNKKGVFSMKDMLEF